MKLFQTGARQFLLNNKLLRSAIIFSFGLLAVLAIIKIANNASSVGAQVSQKTIKGEWSAEIERNNPGEIQADAVMKIAHEADYLRVISPWHWKP